jgi:autotransporter-associated beta strand protein
VTTLVLGRRTGSGTGDAFATLNLGDGALAGAATTTIRALNMAINTSAGGVVVADLNVTGGNVAIGNGGGTAINMANANSGRTVTSTIDLTGGAVTVTGNIARTGGAGTENATITLAGSALNMSGFSIGTAGANIAFVAESGALSNLGQLNGGAALNKTTGAKLTISGTNAYTGPTNVTAGELEIAGTLTGAVAVSAGATLSSANTIVPQIAGLTAGSDETQGSVIDVGGSGGADTSTVGVLTADGNVTLGTTGTAFNTQLKIEIGGTDAGTEYDQLNVTAGRTVNLDNVTLSLTAINGYEFTLPTFSGGEYLTDGDKFFVLTLGAGSTLNGTFLGTNLAGTPNLPGYSTITIGGQDFAINYTANFETNNFAVGSGNDVALMAIPEPNSLHILAGSLGLAIGMQRFRRRRQLV